MKPMSIAVIGSGIAALSAAWLLSKTHKVTVFEKEHRAGGHSNTVDVATPDGKIAVDTGFIVYNPDSYPNLVALFDRLNVKTAETAMTFSASLKNGSYEYSGSGINGLFGQPRNIVSPKHLIMIKDIKRFFNQATAEGDSIAPDVTLADWLSHNNYSKSFINNHLLPMAAAIWSTPSTSALDFPAASFMRFFANHGLLKVRNRPGWRTVRNGSREYVNAIITDANLEVRTNAGIESIQRRESEVIIQDAGGLRQSFDHVVIGAHADEALSMLIDADDVERNLLKSFNYSQNLAVLHTDEALMPVRKRLWSSWNYIERTDHSGGNQLTVSYWMNRLQPLDTATNLFVTLNPARAIDKTKVLAEFNYSHPIFNLEAMKAQRDLWDLQGRRRTWFCGSYFGYGFHEDGCQSGLAVAEDLSGIARPWRVDNANSRIHRKPLVASNSFQRAAE